MPASFAAVLKVLASHEVEFVVVGGVGAVLQGASYSTFDLEIVHARTPENVQRLLAALAELDAVYRTQPEKKLQPGASHLSGTGHQLLLTRFGPLDILGAIGSSREYDDLAAHSVEMTVGGFPVKVLDLETIIRTKEETAGEKDLAVLALLRRVLRQKRGS